MTALTVVPAGLALACIAGGAALAAAAMQPPINNFNFAFYTCDGLGAFQVTYDSDAPKVATLTTNDNNKQYVLTRKRTADGAQFSAGAARFWTDGRRVVVEGTATRLENCKRKVN
jgi:membrane-bound inhibitor of C-type lysozyme